MTDDKWQMTDPGALEGARLRPVVSNSGRLRLASRFVERWGKAKSVRRSFRPFHVALLPPVSDSFIRLFGPHLRSRTRQQAAPGNDPWVMPKPNAIRDRASKTNSPTAWVNRESGDVPGSRLLHADRTATLQSGSPPASPSRYAGAIRTSRSTPKLQYSITPSGQIRGRGRRRGRERSAW